MKRVIHFLYTKALKPVFFLFTKPEPIHDSMVAVGHFMGRFSLTRKISGFFFSYSHKSLEQEVNGISFKNPVGLSAGFDKDAKLVNLLPHIGFGFGEMGTITNNPYEGNTKPRLHRLQKSKSIVVNYGLKNDGVDSIIERIKRSMHDKTVLALSVGRTNSKETAVREKGIQDIKECLSKIIDSDLGNFYVINISCPNLFGGESFYTKESLGELLKALFSLPINKPVYIKMPINLPWADFKELLDVAVSFKCSGVIIGNLNKDRNDPNILDEIPDMKGSMSGLPTQKLSDELILNTYRDYKDELNIIGVGGIFNADDAYRKIKNGASLVAMITGMIFEGPQIVGQINEGIVRLMKEDGYSNIKEAVGSSHK